MTDWASSGGIKVERAKKHLRDLKVELDAFVDRRPYGVTSKVDHEQRAVHHHASVSEQPDLRLGAVIGDILHNLRSALDILWRQVWHPGAADTTHTEEFGIFNSANKFEARYPFAKFPKKGRKQSAVLLLYEIKPYKGGNDLLWMLSEANAVDKHRLLIPAIGWLAFMVTETSEAGGVDLKIRRTLDYPNVGIINPIADGAYLTSTPLDPRPGVNVKVKPLLEITFGQCEAVKGKALTGTLRQFVGEVEGVVEAFRIAGLIV